MIVPEFREFAEDVRPDTSISEASLEHTETSGAAAYFPPVAAHDRFENTSSRADIHSRCRSHVLSRIESAALGEQPFYHSFIEQIFPDDFYEALRAHMIDCKYSDNVQDRHQDNPAFMNKRYNLFESADEVVECIRAVFLDPVVKQALLRKFYVRPSRELAGSLAIHEEFEFFFTKAGRFQNIHVDIPPKFMSFVFYIPERLALPDEEERNATILYDKSLKPHYPARFRANSVCVFVPHFYSYHGFSSTIDRDVLVMFYVNRAELQNWRSLQQEKKDTPPFAGLLDAVEGKLRSHPLIEFGEDEPRLRAERSACLVNAPRGRVLREGEGML